LLALVVIAARVESILREILVLLALPITPEE
jgi:hypothetical protein